MEQQFFKRSNTFTFAKLPKFGKRKGVTEGPGKSHPIKPPQP